MEIIFYGAGCVLINTKKLKILVDPLSGDYGPNPKIKTDIVLFTQQPTKHINATSKTAITVPGEYEVQSVNIEGVAARLHSEEDEGVRKSVIYSVACNGIRAIVTGNIYPEISDEQAERLDGADVLIVPVGGGGLAPDKESASSLVRQFDPSYVVPIHYKDEKTDYPIPQAPVSEFLSEVGASDVEPQSSLKISSRDSNDQTQYAVLNIAN